MESEWDALSGGLDRWRRPVRDKLRLRIARVGFLCLFGLGGNCSKDYGCGLLHGFQTLAQEIGISMPKLDVVGTRGSRFEANRFADHKSHCFGFGFAYFLCCECAAVAAM